MANYDLRTPIDYEFAQLSAGISSLDTTLASPGFTNLPSSLSTTQYVPITLADDSAGVYETVWVTGHSANSTSVTVVRGREGTTARAWASGTTYRCAPTTRDGLPVLTRAALPSDAHIGMRAVLSDESRTVQKTSLGWASTVGGGAQKHAWTQMGGLITSDTDVALVNLVAVAGNASIATYTSGGSGNNLVLNRAGIWTLIFRVSNDSPNAHWTKSWINWPSGPWSPAMNDLVDQRSAPAGYSGAGALDLALTWTGYVTAAQATAPITLYVHQVATPTVSLTMNFYLLAEYLGG